jgi:glutathione peroxidase
MLSFIRALFTRPEPVPPSIYDFKFRSLRGGTVDFADFKGKKLLIVNTASFCGNTPQYAGLQHLYEQYADKLVVVGFPANDFMFQEPGSDDTIAKFYELNYNITFPMASKISVKGRGKAAIYRWLTEKQFNGYTDSKVTWNFQKYLVNEQGHLTNIFSPKTLPESVDIIAAIQR